MTDFTTAGTAHRLHFTDRERREVVVQHEALPGFAIDHFDLLLVVGRAERDGDERLRLAAGEHARAVHARQHGVLDRDLADLVELAAVEADALVQNRVAQGLLLQVVEDALDRRLAGGQLLGQVGDDLLLEPRHRTVVFDLALDAHGRAERRVARALHVCRELLVDLDDRLRQLLAAGVLGEGVDQVADLVDGGLCGFEGLHHLVFRHLGGAGFDHHDAVLAARDDDVEAAHLALRPGRVDDVLSLDQADADARDGLLEGHLRQGERGGGAGQRQHVTVVVGIGRNHRGDDLRLVGPAGREQRPHRAVDHAAGQRFFFSRLAFALEEAAGDAARGIGVLAIVDREGQKVDALAGTRRVARRDEHHGVAQPDDDGAVGLLGQPPGLDGQGLRAER